VFSGVDTWYSCLIKIVKKLKMGKEEKGTDLFNPFIFEV